MIVTNESLMQVNTFRKDILMNVSKQIRDIIQNIPLTQLQRLEEIRLKTGRPLMLYDDLAGWFVLPDGKLRRSEVGAYIVTQEDIDRTIELMSNSSIYAIQEELKNGFITIQGGHRVGITGRVIAYNGKISSIKDIAGMNIRVSKQVIGAANSIMKHIIGVKNNVFNTLIISPPQCGKTTMLRDIARQLSYGIDEYGFIGKKIGIIDERSEIAGCYKGVPQNDVGPRTDVLDACPKAYGMLVMIRSMSPEVIITDEIGMEQDISALLQVLNAGVKIITSVHGYGRKDIMTRPVLEKLLKERLFEKIIVLSKARGTGTIEEVWTVA